jgi:hypothetical protein
MSKSRDRDDLEDEYSVYESLAELSRQARARALNPASKEWVASIHIIGLTEKMSTNEDRKSTINDHFDRVDRALFEQFLARLVATFERRAFEKLRAALGEAKSTVQKHYGSSQPFARAAQHLVMSASDFPNLAKLDTLLKSYPRASVEGFQALREHRNYVAHGSRVGVGAPSRFLKIEEVKDTLRQLLQIISKDVPETD